MKRYRVAVTGAAAVMAAVAASVAMHGEYGNMDIGGGSDAQHAKSIRLGYFPVVGHAIPIVGLEQGIFQERLPGVRIDARVFDSGPQVVESMFAGSIDVAYLGPGPAINAFLNSEDGRIRILSGAASGGTSFVMHPDVASPEFDFAHKRVAAPQIGNTQDVSLRHYMAERGLMAADRGGSVVLYNIPNPDIVTLFVKGEIDGDWVSEPWATVLVEGHGGVRLFYEESMWPGGEFATVLLVADMGYVEANPGVIRAWLDAHEESARVINSDKDEAGVAFNEFLLKHFGQQLGPEVVRTAVHNTKVTTNQLDGTVYEFAERADRLGYMGRGGYDLSGLFLFENVTATGVSDVPPLAAAAAPATAPTSAAKLPILATAMTASTEGAAPVPPLEV